MSLSLAETIARLPDEERAAVLDGVDASQLLHDWPFWGRPEQLTPSGAWQLWVVIAGRGWGKTRAGCEWVRKKAIEMPESRGFLVARTSADVRDVLVNGESGLLNIGPPSERPEWFPSKRLLMWPNGTQALCFSADEPSQLRGPQAHWSLCDEIAAWTFKPDDSGLNAWDNVRLATRLGVNPQITAMTTPKRTPFMRQLLDEEMARTTRVVITRGRTVDNAGNLADAYLNAIFGLYEGTSIGKQELDGEMMDDVEGALWTFELIERARINAVLAAMPLRVVGVDPSVAERPRDECGIIVVGSTIDHELYKRQAWVLEDATVHGSPDVWANKVVETARRWQAPVIAEVNQGGALVRHAIQSIDPTITVLDVHSMHGKKLRAEPIVLTYEQGRVHHVGYLPELESQMTSWIPGEGRSPDRCVARNTMILMGDGVEKPIQDIVPGEMVMTRRGPRQVLAAEMTSPRAVVMSLNTANGRSLVATPNHPVWSETRKQFVALDALAHDMILTWNQTTHRLHSTSQSLSSTAECSTDEHLMSTHSAHIESTISRHEGLRTTIFTDRSMSTSTGQSRQDTTCTTSISTRSITVQRISWLSRLASILTRTQKSSKQRETGGLSSPYPQLHVRNERILLPENEQAVQLVMAGRASNRQNASARGAVRVSGRGTHGIQTSSATRTAEERGTKLVESWSMRHVNNAVRLIRSRRLLRIEHAHQAAETTFDGVSAVELLAVEKDGSQLTQSESAGYAARHTLSSPAQPQSLAQEVVVPSSQSNDVMLAETWNLAIDDVNEYFANGVLTHNCDALVHGLTALLIKPPQGLSGGKIVAKSPARRRLPHPPLVSSRARVVIPSSLRRRTS